MAQQRSVLFLGGSVIAVALAAFLLGESSGGPATAQPPAVVQPPVAGRYQISPFVLPDRNTPGAYILDTQTGEVFQVVGRDEPVRLGSVTKPQPRK